MKIFATAILLFGILAICGADETDGWDAFREHFKIGDPELKFLPLIHSTEFEGDSFTIKIRNDSKEPMSYQGYFSDDPEYFTSEFVDGAWEPRPELWCGTGMEGHLLKPGDEVTFSFQSHLKKRQIFVIFHGTERRSSLVKVWYPEKGSATKY